MDWFLSAGFSRELAEDLFNSLAAFVRGVAFGETMFGDESTADGTVWNDDRAFERGLDAMIDGFSHMLAQEQEGSVS